MGGDEIEHPGGNTMSATRVRRLLAWGAVLAPALCLSAVGRAADQAVDLTKAWTDLASGDQTRAARAAVLFGKSPKEAVAFLKERLRPVKADSAYAARCIADLDADEVGTREDAQLRLEYLGKYVKDDLKKAHAADVGAEAKKRIETLLDAIAAGEKAAAPAPSPNPGNAKSISVRNVNGQVTVIVDGVPLDLSPKVAAPTGPPRTWVLVARAVGVLEALDTPESRAILQDLASGEADALPTTAAKEALGRMTGK
jgi:hypothetical protein